MIASTLQPLLRDILLGYLLGSIPSGYLLTKFSGHGDLRQIGSGNIGATNVLRTGKKSLAVLTLVFDMLKGTCAVLIAQSFQGPSGLAPFYAYLSGLAAFLGHLFPVWLRFKGGKGVATYIGVLLGLSWTATGVFCAVWLVIALLTRISSLSALCASVATPLFFLLKGTLQEVCFFGLMTILLIWKHTANIQRILEGKEPHIGKK